VKRKPARCSTGHGTGLTPPVDLRALIGRGRHSRLFAGRPRGIAQGGVDRPAAKRGLRPEQRRATEGRVGYFRKCRQRLAAIAAENIRNLSAWA
jgi:hypothetical protein